MRKIFKLRKNALLMKKRGFDTRKYLEAQTAKIKERLSKFDNKLYLEFGGKILYDGHASRVLPGYQADAKIQLISKLKDLEVIYCISAKDIQKGRVRYDSGLTYDLQTLNEINEIKEKGLKIMGIVITRYERENLALKFKRKLQHLGHTVYVHTEIKGYPNNIKKILSKGGFAKQPFIKTYSPLIIVTGAGGGSGKMAVCLSQLFHEQKKGVNAGYAKFETFPIWNLPLNHPVNTAYEAATADLGDYNMIDPFHLKKYKTKSVNYNRDVENFVILKRIMKAVTKKDNYVNNYFSPTDMGVNMAKVGILDDKIVRKSAKEEIIRRYFRYKQEYTLGIETKRTIDYMGQIMAKSKVSEANYPLVKEARKGALKARARKEGHKGAYCGAAVELRDGTIVRAHNSRWFHAESAVIIKALKKLSKVHKSKRLLHQDMITQMQLLKQKLGEEGASLNVEETMVLIGISALTDRNAKMVLDHVDMLRGLNMHLTHIPKNGDEAGIKKLRLNVTTDSEMKLQ